MVRKLAIVNNQSFFGYLPWILIISFVLLSSLSINKQIFWYKSINTYNDNSGEVIGKSLFSRHASPGMGSPGIGSPGMSPGMGSPGMGSPGMDSPGIGSHKSPRP